MTLTDLADRLRAVAALYPPGDQANFLRTHAVVLEKALRLCEDADCLIPDGIVSPDHGRFRSAWKRRYRALCEEVSR